MNKYIFYIGKNDKDQRKQVLSDNEFIYYISDCFKNFIITESIGYYTYENGFTQEEKSLAVTVFDNFSQSTLDVKIEFLKVYLNQKTIGLEIVNNCNINFV